MLKMRQENLISDLSEILENVYSTLDVNFIFGGENIYLDEVFQYWGLLGIFLHDKQSYINTFCERELPEGSFVNIVFNWLDPAKNTDSLLALKIGAEHNLSNEQYYRKFLMFLTTLIVTDSALPKVASEFKLDNYYEKFFTAVNQAPRSSNTKN